MKFKLKPLVRIEQSPTKIILIDDGNSDFYECSETAFFLLKKLINGATRETLVEELFAEYDITLGDAHAQVDYCLGLLGTIGMLNEAT